MEKEKSLYDLLTEKMNEECKVLMEKVYPKFKEQKLNMIAKSAIKNDWFLSRIYNDKNYVYSKYISEQEVLQELKDLYDGVVFENNFNHKLLFLSLPMFERLLNSKDIGIRNAAYDIFFKLHCAYDINEFLFNDKLNYASGFNFKSLCGIEHLVNVSNSEFSLRTVLSFLNFANFELSKQTVDEPYYDKLTELYGNLYRYFNFAADEETIIKFENSTDKKDGWKVKYSDKELSVKKDNLELVEFFYGKEMPKFINKFYQFNIMEGLMTLVEDEDKRKEMLLASFCYSEYCDNDFFKAFDDVKLSVEDLVRFVKKYEESGHSFSKRQATMLLKSFELRHFDKLGLKEEYVNERKIIKDLYKDYYIDNFAFSDFEFIDYINNLFPEGFDTLNLDNDKKLNYQELLFAFNNTFIGIGELKGTKVYDYFNVNEYDEDKYRNIESLYAEYRLQKFDEYYPLVLKQLESDYTQNYFIRHNVVPEDREIALEVFDWANHTTDAKAQRRKETTVELLKNEFVDELNVNHFDKKKEVFNTYLGYLESDDLFDVFSARDLINLYDKCNAERIEKMSPDIICRLNDAIENEENLFVSLSDFHCSSRDMLVIFRRNNIPKALYQKYKDDREVYIAEHPEFDGVEENVSTVNKDVKTLVKKDSN